MRMPASDRRGSTVITGFRLYCPELPRLTIDSQTWKSSTKSATLSAAMSMSMLVLTPLCWPLGVVSAVSLPPVGVTELASGWAASLGDKTRRNWVYLPVGNAVCPSSSSKPLVRVSRFT